MIDATCLSEPNPDWSFIDRKGHKHRWSKSNTLPTLNSVCDEWVYDEDEERYCARNHYECKKCREHVTPGLRAGTPKYVRGFQQPLEVNASVDLDQWDHLISIIDSGEKCTLLLPHELPDTLAYLTSVNKTVDGQIEITLKGTGPQ
jgi:hypothetical protein